MYVCVDELGFVSMHMYTHILTYTYIYSYTHTYPHNPHTHTPKHKTNQHGHILTPPTPKTTPTDHLDKDKTGVLNEADVAKDVEKTYSGVKYRRAYTRQRHGGGSSPARPLKAKAAASGGGGRGVGVGVGGEESKDAGVKR